MMGSFKFAEKNNNQYRAYVRALNIEYQINEFYSWHRMGVRNLAWVPHIMALPPSVIIVLKRLRKLQVLFALIWLLLIVPVVALKDALKILSTKSFAEKKSLPLCQGSVYLGSSIAEHLSAIKMKRTLPSYYLSLPWGNIPNDIPDSVKVIDISDLVTPSDLLVAASQHLAFSIALVCTPRNFKLWMHTYMGYRWFLVSLVLKRIDPEEIWISNHFDRWTVLTEFSGIANKVMVQHGQLEIWSIIDKKTVYFSPSPKISGKWTFLYFTENAHKIFANYVFDGEPASRCRFCPKYTIFQPRTDLPVVLVIGAPHLLREQEGEVAALLKRFNNEISIFYRPHPRQHDQAYLKQMTKLGVRIESRDLPKSSAVLSYPSTLNEEIDKLRLAPVFIFDYSNRSGSEKVRKNLYKYLSTISGNK